MQSNNKSGNPYIKIAHFKESKKAMLQKNFEFSINNDFSTIISNCANREETWINKSIENIYNKLHALGYAHSIEVWEEKS